MSHSSPDVLAPGQVRSVGKRTYFPELDGVRAVAITMVMLFHIQQSGVPFPAFVAFGQTGVDLFFVLSGFLITGILLKAEQHDWHEVRTFYVRRTLRIFPLYYGTLLILWLGLMRMPVSWDVWLYLQSFSLAFHRTMHGPNHFWSLSVEEQFYLIWPFVVLFLARKRLPLILTIAFVGALLLRLWALRFGIAVYYWTPTRMDALVAGAFVAWQQYRGKLTTSRSVAWCALTASIVLLVVCSALMRSYGHYWPQVLKYSAYAALYAALLALLLTAKHPFLRTALSASPLRFVGRISYGLYVFHPLVLHEVMKYMPQSSPFTKAALTLLLSLACAIASWYGFEKRLLALKDRFAPERTQFSPKYAGQAL